MTTTIPHTPAAAALARDAMSKIMYSRLFNFVVARINASVDGSLSDSPRGSLSAQGSGVDASLDEDAPLPTPSPLPQPSCARHIGLLDV